MRPGPPNFFMSRQKWQSPHSVRTQARQRRQRVRRRRAPAPGPRLLDDIGGVSNAEGCRQMEVRSERPAERWPPRILAASSRHLWWGRAISTLEPRRSALQCPA